MSLSLSGLISPRGAPWRTSVGNGREQDARCPRADRGHAIHAREPLVQVSSFIISKGGFASQPNSRIGAETDSATGQPPYPDFEKRRLELALPIQV